MEIPTAHQTLDLTTIRFPEIQLQMRDAHKLRGYFGNLFREHSPLLHNHYENGEFRNSYPLVQYKVIDKTPTLVALDKGAFLLNQLFLKMHELHIDNYTYPIHNKLINAQSVEVGHTNQLIRYRFTTRWMALNQTNHKKYLSATPQQQQDMLQRILVGNILSFFKGIDLQLEPHERLMASVTHLKPGTTQFKDNTMLAFGGEFVVNALLPDNIGLGKSVSRGFGTIQRINP